MPTAVLIDGGFFKKRFHRIYPAIARNPHAMAKHLFTLALKHIEQDKGEKLYRIYYYDCPPLTKKAHHPITKQCIDFSKTRTALFQDEFFNELKKLRKVALRIGMLRDNNRWQIHKEKLKEIIRANDRPPLLQEKDVYYDAEQKGVDMRIGLDIASLAYKKLVDKIILISGDCDFVPAAKLARREGIDFVLDPMWNHINPELHEHIDGLKSTCPRPVPITTAQTTGPSNAPATATPTASAPRPASGGAACS
jgi:uncharacterized LabA/DUF88 family protein